MQGLHSSRDASSVVPVAAAPEQALNGVPAGVQAAKIVMFSCPFSVSTPGNPRKPRRSGG